MQTIKKIKLEIKMKNVSLTNCITWNSCKPQLNHGVKQD